MPASFYRGAEFEHPQEKEAFHRLCSAVAEYIIDGEDVRVVGSLVGKRLQIDALVLRCRSITVIDFKDYGGRIWASEDAPWTTDEGVEVKGGSWPNPYRQVRQYKFTLAKWLNMNRLLPPSNDPGHISGLVMFTQPARVDVSAMSAAAKKWFGAADFVGGTTFLRNRASPELDLPTARLDAIVEALGVRPHALREAELFVPASHVARAEKDGYFKAMQDVEDDENAKWWEENGDRLRREYDEARRGWDAIDFPDDEE
jgi:hypothetical protein